MLKKISLLVIATPMLAMAITSCNGAKKITFEEAMNFAHENHDPHQYDGYNVSYTINSGNTKATNAHVLRKHYINIEGDYYLEKAYDINADLSGVNGTLVFNLPIAFPSSLLIQLNDSVSIVKAALGYVDCGFTKSGNHLGYYIVSDNLTPIVNLAGAIFGLLGPMLGEMLPIDIGSFLSSLSVEDANFNVDLEMTRFGFFSTLDLDLNLKGGLVALGEEMAGELNGNYITFDDLTIDLNLTANYTL